ncbi:MAG: hypothetical protein EOS41_28980 [Mesorhizobium sp.]|uniref:arginase family protein n=1 Tax=Mesorhizobium sp. TaxID=1871066 RepID=UPI000FE6EA4B|nr:MAG: hypothetical protein EOS41_28980 [Mesorhizobium sp.]
MSTLLQRSCSSSPLTFLGVSSCQKPVEIDADVVVVGIPCATPSMHNQQYSLAGLAGPTALRRTSAMLSAYHDRYDWDLKAPVLAANRVVDIGDLPVNFNQPEANRTILGTLLKS